MIAGAASGGVGRTENEHSFILQREAERLCCGVCGKDGGIKFECTHNNVRILKAVQIDLLDSPTLLQ